MDVTAAVITHLESDPRFKDIRISRATNSPFPKLPSVVVSKIDDVRGNHSSTSRYSIARVQCSCYANTDTEADEVSELVADALDATVNTVIGGLYIISCFDAGTVPDSNPKTSVYVYNRDFRVAYSVRI